MIARILKSVDLSPTAKLFTLRVEGNFSFLPGQYTSFSVNGAVRTYSICSLPSDLPIFEFCVRQLQGGVGTNFLNQNIGKEIELTAPAGDFVIAGKLDRLVIMASGVGIAPVRPMLKDYLARYPDAEAELVYHLKGDEYLFQKEWEEMENKNGNFKVYHDSTSPLSSPRQGRRVFVVGSPTFVSEVTARLLDLGYNKRDIKIDIWEA